MQEKNVTKQVIVRFFAPDMHTLKVTAKQLSVTSPDLKLGLYGQADEILVVLNAQSYAEAAATQLTEHGAEAFEQAMGDYSYGRGKGGLAYVTAGELIEGNAIITAADDATGSLLETEFQATKRGEKVYDFGDESYLNDKISTKIEKQATYDPDEETAPYQAAADWAYAAAKVTKSDFGVAIKGIGTDKLYSAVAHGKYVYIREIPAGKDAEKCAALTALDITRRLLIGADVPYAKSFKVGQEVNWDDAADAAPAPKAKKAAKNVSYNDDEDDYEAPKKKKAATQSGEKSKVVPIIVLCVLLVALAGAVWYLLTTFFFNKTDNKVDTSSSQSIAQSVSQSVAADSTESVPTEGDAASLPAEGEAPAESTSAVTADATAASTANSGVVHPFG